MVTGIDHLVIVVPNLDAAIRGYRELGFTVVEGGRHPVGTHNALIAFADGAYLELLAFDRESPQHRWWRPLQKGGGLVDFCLATDDLLADTRAFRAAGVDIADPTAQSRVRPDGYETPPVSVGSAPVTAGSMWMLVCSSACRPSANGATARACAGKSSQSPCVSSVNESGSASSLRSTMRPSKRSRRT